MAAFSFTMKGTWDWFLIRFVQSWFVDCLSQDRAFVTDGDVSAAYNTSGDATDATDSVEGRLNLRMIVPFRDWSNNRAATKDHTTQHWRRPLSDKVQQRQFSCFTIP